MIKSSHIGREFEQHAARIIDMCFNEDEGLALQILTTKSKLYFGYSLIALAEENHNQAFMATKTVQKFLDRAWFSHVNTYGHGDFYIAIKYLIPKDEIDQPKLTYPENLRWWKRQ
ncbi:unnamed protein product [Didymodactylos carnosus]|uniref:TRPM-like domain-containing protein n=1 Tax=Didymodactylos carnosus TaxID=1234261 RepID=A0A814QGM5_9BILA|nr:unnamed protein product [Didymodactylos carnosus]CAF1119391.1 unnamed protein product [Didymodactylos carnosus]CAF3678702.1 unnamed protein product [Didymodactylos carnosus]CAF3883072.1 unnamed protein product [Didymodactylos carnosus]